MNNQNQQNQGQLQQHQYQPNYSPDDFEKVGPRSVEGLEAGEMPDGGRGEVSTNISKEAGRKLPPQTGQWGSEGDTGLRGDPDIADASDHGRSRKHT